MMISSGALTRVARAAVCPAPLEVQGGGKVLQPPGKRRVEKQHLDEAEHLGGGGLPSP